MKRFLSPLLALAALAGVSAAHAQEIVFQQIPWTAPPDTVRARLEAQGFTYRGIQDGRRTFVRPDSAYVYAMFRGVEHAVGFIVGDPARGPRAEGRFRQLADSLQARLGQPVDRRPDAVRWERGLTSVTVVLRSYDDGARVVQTGYTGPGWLDEAAADGSGPGLADLPAGYTTVAQLAAMRVAIDTSSISALTGGYLRARYRVDYAEPRAGAGERYDAIEYAMDFDCGGGRTRLYSRTPLLAGRRQRTDSSAGLPWHAATAGSEESRALDGVCRARGRGPATVARPAQTRRFGALPPGWIVLAESDEGRWSVDSASVAPRGGGIYTATVRTENGSTQPSPWGR
ncbi:MAG TPA: hypothetical protein VFJ82_10345, partial [Longimicrobium sp.]|nr:hypothetical protein [Longimicrobium sp.]